MPDDIEGSNLTSDTPQTAFPPDQTQPEAELARKVRQCLAAGDFARARRLVRTLPADAPLETRVQLADHARRLAPDPAAWLVACAVGAALVATAAITLFH